MSGMKNAFTHYIGANGHDCYSPNFESKVTRITVFNQDKLFTAMFPPLEITVEFEDGGVNFHAYSEFEAVLSDVEGGEYNGTKD